MWYNHRPSHSKTVYINSDHSLDVFLALTKPFQNSTDNSFVQQAELTFLDHCFVHTHEVCVQNHGIVKKFKYFAGQCCDVCLIKWKSAVKSFESNANKKESKTVEYLAYLQIQLLLIKYSCSSKASAIIIIPATHQNNSKATKKVRVEYFGFNK